MTTGSTTKYVRYGTTTRFYAMAATIRHMLQCIRAVTSNWHISYSHNRLIAATATHLPLVIDPMVYVEHTTTWSFQPQTKE